MSVERLENVCRPFGRDSELADCTAWRAGLLSSAALERVADAAPAAMADLHDDPDRPGVRVPGAEFYEAFAVAVREVQREARERAGRKARTPWDWGELVATPLDGPDRPKVLLRIGRKLLHHKLGEPMVLAMMLVHNQCMCSQALDPVEVEQLWRWVCDRHREGDGG